MIDIAADWDTEKGTTIDIWSGVSVLKKEGAALAQ